MINEHTDAEGWQYARCFWLRLGALRLGGRAQERWLDFVKRRQVRSCRAFLSSFWL